MLKTAPHDELDSALESSGGTANASLRAPAARRRRRRAPSRKIILTPVLPGGAFFETLFLKIFFFNFNNKLFVVYQDRKMLHFPMPSIRDVGVLFCDHLHFPFSLFSGGGKSVSPVFSPISSK